MFAPCPSSRFVCLRMSFQLTRESERLETYLVYMIRGSRAPHRLLMNKFHVLPFPTTHLIATRNDDYESTIMRTTRHREMLPNRDKYQQTTMCVTPLKDLLQVGHNWSAAVLCPLSMCFFNSQGYLNVFPQTPQRCLLGRECRLTRLQTFHASFLVLQHTSLVQIAKRRCISALTQMMRYKQSRCHYARHDKAIYI